MIISYNFPASDDRVTATGMESKKKPVRLLDTMISRLRKVHRTEHDIAMDLFDTTFIEDMDDELWVEKNAIRARLMKCIEETDDICEELWKLRMKIEYPHRRD